MNRSEWEGMEIAELSALETLEAIHCEQEFLKEFPIELSLEIVKGIAERAVLGSFCLKSSDGKKRFENPLEVLQKLTLEQLCNTYEEYQRKYLQEWEEWGENSCLEE